MSRNPHTDLVDDTIVALGKRPDLGKFWKRNTGRARGMKDYSKIIAYGFKGSGDIEGILNNGYATHAELEAKTGAGKQSERQINFEGMAKSYGAHYFVFHTVEEVIAEIERLCALKPAKTFWKPNPMKF